MGCGSSTSAGGSSGAQPTSGAAYVVAEPHQQQQQQHQATLHQTQTTQTTATTQAQTKAEVAPIKESNAPTSTVTATRATNEPAPPTVSEPPPVASDSLHVESSGRKSANSKRLTLPTPNAGSVGTTALNLALIADGFTPDRSGPGSARGRRTPPGSARRRKDESERDGEMLVSIPFFESLEPKAIRKLRDAFHRRKYAAGEWIVRTSKPESVKADPAAPPVADDFVVIISGSVQLSVRLPTSKTTASSKPLSSHPDPNELPATEYEDVTLAVLRDGQWFGVEALVQDSLQRTDVLALNDCVLLSISREAFRTFSADIPSMHTCIADVVTNTRVQLSSLPFFAHVDQLKLQQLSQLLEFRRFVSGDVIVREGEMSDGFFVIVNGSAQVSVHTPDNATFLLSTLKSGDYFGETSLLSTPSLGTPTLNEMKPSPRVATVTATSDMLLLYLSSIRFARFGRLAPEVFSDAFSRIAEQRTTQLLKTIPLFDVLCLEKITPPSTTISRTNSTVTLAPTTSTTTPSPNTNADGEIVVDVTKTTRYDEHKLSLLASMFTYESFQTPRSEIFHEGDRADKLYIIVRGSVEVSAKVESGTVVLNTLTQSMFFGEISMMFPTLRSATVTTLEPTLCLTLTADKFSRFLAIAPELKERLSFAIGPRVATIIENIPFFRNEIRENKPWSKLGLLGELCQFQKAEENEVLFRQGDKADKFFVIVAGAVLVTKAEPAIPEEGDDPANATTRRASGGLADVHHASHIRAPTVLPGVILRRGNWFGEEGLIPSDSFDSSQSTRWGTVTSLALSVFLTLSRENFDKYIKIAPELKELIKNRQQSSIDASMNGASNITSSKRDPAAILRVAGNQSLDTSPIFSTDEDHGPEFTPSRAVAEQHPHLNRFSTTVPQKTRTLGGGGATPPPQQNRAASMAIGVSTAAASAFPSAHHQREPSTPTSKNSTLQPLIVNGSPLDRPAMGRLPSLPVLGASPSHSHTQPPSPIAPLGSPERRANHAAAEPKELELYHMQNQ